VEPLENAAMGDNFDQAEAVRALAVVVLALLQRVGDLEKQVGQAPAAMEAPARKPKVRGL
jgi:hypothetical protein